MASRLLDLQRTAGNKATAALVAQADRGPDQGHRSERRTVQTLLDGQYKPTAIKAAGHKANYVFQKTAFAKLLDSLEGYFKQQTPEAQFMALAAVKTKIDAYEGSTSRMKQRKGSNKRREDAKQTLVTQLAAAVTVEIATINAVPTMNVLNANMAQSADTTVLVVAQNVAKMLGTDLAGLLVLGPATLRNRFITEVYLPQTMAERAGTKAPGMSVAEQFDHIRHVNRIDPKTLTPRSQALQLFDLIEQAELGKDVRGSADPKFGGTTVEDYTPAIKGWSKQKAIGIKGGDSYRQKVKSMVDLIAQTAVGVRLLEGIGGVSSAEAKGDSPVHPDTKSRIASINPPSLANVNYVDSTGEYMYANSAGKGAATVDAFNDVIGSDPGKVKDEPFRQRDAVVGLFHELVHVYLGAVDEKPFVSLEDPSQTMSVGLMYEPRVAGIHIEQKRNDKTYTYPYEDPAYNYVSENTFRREYAALKGETEYLVRPYYEGKGDEVVGPTGKQKV